MGDAPGYTTTGGQCDVDDNSKKLMGDANWFGYLMMLVEFIVNLKVSQSA